MAKVWWCRHAKKYAVDICKAGKRKRFYLHRERKQATEMYHQLMADINNGKIRFFGAPELTLEELAEMFLEHAHRNKARNTFLHYQRLISDFVRHNRGKAATDITPLDLEKHKQRLIQANLSNTTINHSLQAVRIMYNWAVEFELIKEHNLKKVKLMPKVPGKVRFLKEDEVNRLLSACNHHLKKIVTVFLHTGMRLSELTNLDWNEVDLEHRQISIFESKSSRTARKYRPRIIPMTKTVYEIFDGLKPKQGLVFLNDAGKPYDKDSLRRKFDRAKKKVGLNDITIHTLRHTFASNLSMGGETLQTIAALLGHTTTRTTEIYAHLAPEHLRKAVQKLEISPGT